MPDCHHHHHHHHHIFWKCQFLPRYTRVEHLPIWGLSTYPWILPIQDVNQALSYHHPHILSKSSYSSPYISPLPPPPFDRPIPNIHTPKLQMPKPPQSAMPHHRLYKSTLRSLSFSDTPHIHLTIIHSVLSRFFRFAFFIAQISVLYVNTLWTQVLYIFPFIQYDAPQAVRIGDNSLNLAQAHLALALAAFSTPPPAPSVSPK